MKIAVTSTGRDLDSDVDPRFGRGRYFIIYDTEDKSFTVMDNEQNMGAPQGAGVQSGQNVVRAGVEALITGNCGPRAFQVLKEAGIKVYIGAQGTVKQAITDYEEGRLTTAAQPNVQGHW